MHRIFESNTVLKISSVLIAAALWFFVNSRGVSEITIAVPIEIKSLPDGYEIVTSKTKEVNLGLKGHERLIKTLRVQNLGVYLDLSEPKEGWETYYVNKESIVVPPSIEVTKIDPSVVKIRVAQTIEKNVPVKVDIKGTPKKGYEISSVDITPQSVRIIGAKNLINSLKRMKTEPVSVEGKDAPVKESVKILTNGKNVRLSDDTVKVNVTIIRREK